MGLGLGLRETSVDGMLQLLVELLVGVLILRKYGHGDVDGHGHGHGVWEGINVLNMLSYWRIVYKICTWWVIKLLITILESSIADMYSKRVGQNDIFRASQNITRHVAVHGVNSILVWINNRNILKVKITCLNWLLYTWNKE